MLSAYSVESRRLKTAGEHMRGEFEEGAVPPTMIRRIVRCKKEIGRIGNTDAPDFYEESPRLCDLAALVTERAESHQQPRQPQR